MLLIISKNSHSVRQLKLLRQMLISHVARRKQNLPKKKSHFRKDNLMLQSRNKLKLRNMLNSKMPMQNFIHNSVKQKL